MNHSRGSFRGIDGESLFFQSWRPQGPLRASVGIVHGWGEHSDRYQNVVGPLIESRYAVYGFDQRGHGLSPGKRGHINVWEEYREDLRLFLTLIMEQQPGQPVFLLGHSLGALIALDYLLHYPGELRGAILSGSPLRPASVAKPHLVLLSRILSRVWPSFSVDMRLDATELSRDGDAVQKSRDDPLMHGRASARWGTEVLLAISRVKSNASGLVDAVLFLHGEADRVNLAEGARTTFQAISASDKTMRIYPGMYHELHNDIGHEQVMEDIKDWLEGRV